jgi:type IV pilus assembly protein PilE
MMKTTTLQRKPAGFTLIELMIVVAIVGILAAIAIPAYRQYVMKSHRSVAKSTLMEMSGRMERYYTLNNAYPSSATSLGYSEAMVTVPSAADPYYNVSVVNGGNAYTLQAAPTGSQTGDTCDTYTLNNLGVQGNSGATSSSADCWK